MRIPERHRRKGRTIVSTAKDTDPHVMAGIDSHLFARTFYRSHELFQVVAVELNVLGPSAVGAGVCFDVNPDSVVVYAVEALDHLGDLALGGSWWAGAGEHVYPGVGHAGLLGVG